MKKADQTAAIIVVLDNLRSCHNVGSILRTANGFGCQSFVFIGTTPYPRTETDERLPHAISRQNKQIAKTALGAEADICGQHYAEVSAFLQNKEPNRPLICLEQTPQSQALSSYRPKGGIYLVFGGEIEGVSSQILEAAEEHLSIPMLGRKESFNVAITAAIALYQLVAHSRIV